jgi:hypothetical protein
MVRLLDLALQTRRSLQSFAEKMLGEPAGHHQGSGRSITKHVNCYIAPISTLKEVAQKTLVNVFRTFQVQRRAWFFTVKKPFEPTNDRRRLRNDGKAMVEDGGETG